MSNKNFRQFKGEIENYLNKEQNNISLKIDDCLSDLKTKTLLCKSNIFKKDGFHAAHLLFVLLIMPLIKVKTVCGFCEKHWTQWSESRKDTLYRFKKNASYRWRSFMFKINREILQDTKDTPQKERCFVVDDTILQKTGKQIENTSYVYDHNLGRSVLGFCVAALGLFTPNGFYVLDFAYRFSKRRHDKSPEKIGDKRKSSGQRSFEAKHYTKLQLALQMIQRAVNCGILPGYVLFDSWYAWPCLINGIRGINKTMHVVCRLKQSNVKYLYNGKPYTLKELYRRIKKQLKKDKRTGLFLKRVTVKMPDSDEDVVIVFSRGYHEPELNEKVKGKKKKKKSKWAAFLSTDTHIHASTIIRIYIKRWAVEVCFKECKQMLYLGKEQSNNFEAQVFSTTASFLIYNLLNCLNEKENHATLGRLFEHLSDEFMAVSYARRLWDFFSGLFMVSLSTIFELFKINEDFHEYFDVLTTAVQNSQLFQGCET